MDSYHVVLFVHLLTLIVAAAISSLVHFAMTRRNAATTGLEALQWHGLGGKVSRFFPVLLILFFATGGFMAGKVWTWQAGFVEAGSIGAILLFVNGITMAVKSKALVPLLLEVGNKPLDDATRARVYDPIMNTLPWVNHMIAISVALVMTLKPTLTESLGVLLAGIAIGLVLAARFSPTRAVASAQQQRVGA